jgi:hypothetical protein
VDAASIETKEIYAESDTVRPRSRPKQKRPVPGLSRKVKLMIAGGVTAVLIFLGLVFYIFRG